MKIIIVIFLVFAFYKSPGQSYKTIKTNAEYYFMYDSIIRSVRIDSTKIQGKDTVLYNFRCMRNPVIPETCGNLFGPSWLGEKMIIKPNGDNLFINKFKDSIKINTRAPMNESWILYKYSNLNYIAATITKIDTSSFIGLSDTVKTITLLVKNSSNNSVTHFLNNKTILLSKHYGLVKMPDFYEFPYDSVPDVTSSNYKAEYKPFYDIIGKTNPNKGVINVTAREIFDFSISDQFHTEEIIATLGPQLKWKKLLISTVIDKSYAGNNDTVKYKIRRYGSYETWTNASDHKLSQISDTISVRYNLTNNALDYQPHETFYANNAYQFYDLGSNNLYNRRLVKHNINLLPSSNSAGLCNQFGRYTPGPDYLYCIQGLGGFYRTGVYDNTIPDHYKLVYYKKGTETWGTPLNPASLGINVNKQLVPVVSIYPNPLHDISFLKVQGDIRFPIEFILYNSMGVQMRRTTIVNENALKIERGTLTNGIYFYLLWTKNGKQLSGKLVVE